MAREQPLGDVHGQRHINTTSTALSPSLLGQPCDDDTDETIIYPPIIDVLQEMHVTMPLLNMPQYEAVLIEHGIAYANNAVGISDHWFIDVIHMPIGVTRSFFDTIRRFIRRARKGKGNAINGIDKENCDPNSYIRRRQIRRQQSVEV
jgi:hypothetical protein